MFWLVLVVVIFSASFLYASWRAAPWVPIRANDVQRVIALARLKEGEVFYDLGSGDGRTLLAAAKAGAKAEGFEISLLPYLIAKVREKFANTKTRPQTHFKDFWHIDLSQADVVYIFLMPAVREKMKEKMERELRPGTRVICYVWPMLGWTETEIDNLPDRPKLRLYIR
jgi:SAM-dependent methyltransferase